MVALFELKGKKIAIVVLNSKDRKSDIIKIKEWVEKL